MKISVASAHSLPCPKYGQELIVQQEFPWGEPDLIWALHERVGGG